MVVGLLFVAAFPPVAVAQAPAGEASPAAIDSVFRQYDHSSTPGCALGVFRDGRIVYERGYGMADLNQGIAITPHTVFYIASTSKQFTAFATALLVEQGRIALSDPVRKYVPELPAWGDSITVDELVHHTSGARDYLGLWGMSGRSFADEIPSVEALALISRQRALNFAPGSEWSYSNSGFFLLSEIVGRVTGGSLRQFTEQAMFGPLGMRSTHFHDDNAEIVPDRAEGYQPDGAGGFQIVRTSFALVGDGGLLTTVEDLAKWDENFYHNRLGGGQALIDRVTTPGHLADGEAIDYAFGLFKGTHRGLTMIQHGGSFIGFRAQLTRFPTEHFSVAVLCNDYTAQPEAMALRVADRYLADRLAPEPTKAAGPGGAGVPVSLAALDRLVGRYAIVPGLVVSVVRDSGGLAARIRGAPPMSLRATSDSTFTAEGLPGELRFTGSGAPALAVPGMGVKVPAPRLVDPPPLTPSALAAYTGRYTSDELDTWVELRAADGGLEVRRRFQPWEKLQAIAPDRFVGGGSEARFERDRRGRVTGFTLNAARVLGIQFVKAGP